MNLITSNKKATFEYAILDTYIAGIQLSGTEVKSIKDTKVSISEAYCTIIDGEAYIKNMHIAEYMQIKHTNHLPTRDRKLLLNKQEINKLSKALKEKGLSIVPLAVLTTNTGLIKIRIALGKGKKVYDKREAIKQKDLKRDLEKNP